MAQQVMTRAGYERLQAQLKSLEERHQEALEQLQQLKREEGQDNSIMYDAETRRQDIENKITSLKNTLADAVIADNDAVNTVTVGNRVTVLDLETDETFTVDLVSPAEVTSGVNGVSTESPVGSALLDHEVGDRIKVEVPDGSMEYEIKAIEPIPEDDE